MLSVKQVICKIISFLVPISHFSVFYVLSGTVFSVKKKKYFSCVLHNVFFVKRDTTVLYHIDKAFEKFISFLISWFKSCCHMISGASCISLRPWTGFSPLLYRYGPQVGMVPPILHGGKGCRSHCEAGPTARPVPGGSDEEDTGHWRRG